MSGTPYRRYVVPRGDGERLVEPGFDRVPEWIARWQDNVARADIEIAGEPLASLATKARASLVEAACDYTSSYAELPQSVSKRANDMPLVLSGHQAELYHPGVWFKNFVLSRLARERGGVGIHLVIDSDLSRRAAVQVPTGRTVQPTIEAVAIDRFAGVVPWELQRVVDRSAVESFAQRVSKRLAGHVDDPLIVNFWPEVIAQLPAVDDCWPWALSRARHLLQRSWGDDQTLEIPISRVCELREVRRLMFHLLTSARQVREAYNRALARYRRAHKLRSPAQPMPDLAVDGEWIESPLWIYRRDNPERKPLFARSSPEGLQLSNGDDWQTTLPGDCDSALDAWEDLQREGVLIRTRALTTTLIARLLLCDLFLHGIGGAKYDEVTSDLCRELFGIAPADYLTLSATVLLPVDYPSVDAGDLAAIDFEQRELRFHPERYLPSPSPTEIEPAVAQKMRAIGTPKTPQNAATRHREIELANTAMSDFLAERSRQLVALRREKQQQLAASQVWGARDYSFCLYPEAFLRERLLSMVTTG